MGSLVNTVTITLNAAAGNDTASEDSTNAALGAFVALTNTAVEVSADISNAVFAVLDNILESDTSGAEPAPLSTATAQASADILLNLLNANIAVSNAGRALQTRSTTSAQVLDSLLIIHQRTLVDAQPNEAPVVFTSGLEELSGTELCVPTDVNTIAMQSQLLQCSTGLQQEGTDDIGTAVSVVETCNAGNAAFFGAAGTTSTHVSVRAPHAHLMPESGSPLCTAEVGMQLLSLTRPLADSASARDAIDAEYLHVDPDSNVTIAVHGTVFAGPTIHVVATRNSQTVALAHSDVLRVSLPLTEDPAVPASADLVLPGPTAAGSSRRLSLTSSNASNVFEEDFSVTCPSDSAAYVAGRATVSSDCATGSYNVTCTEDQAGGTLSGACPVDAFTAACMMYDSGAAAWSADSCAVVQVSNAFLTCECSGAGAFAPAFATVARPAGQAEFTPADGDGSGAGASDDDEFTGATLAGIIAISVLVIAVVAVIIYSVTKQQKHNRMVKEEGVGASAPSQA